MIAYYEIDPEGYLVPVEEKDAKKGGKFRYYDGNMVRVGDGKAPINYSGNDTLNGVRGIFNPVDGKRYDSKSAYYQAVKDSGHVIMGNDAPTKPTNTTIRGDFDNKKDVVNAIREVTKERGIKSIWKTR